MDTLLREPSHRVARIRTRRPLTATAAVLAIAALSLSACAGSPAPATTDAATPPASETTEPTAAPAPGSAQPASRYDLTCDELVPQQAVSDMFDVALEPVDPLVTAAAAGISVPRMTSVLSVGGLACGWSNGAEYNSQFGTNPAYTGVLVTVVPPQDAGWSPRAIQAGMPAPDASCTADVCTMTRVASGAWIAVEGEAGPATILPAGADAVANAAVAAVDAASPPAAAAEVPTRIPEGCEAVLPAAQVEQITGATGLTVSEQGGGGWSDWAEAGWIAGDLGCSWTPPDSEESVVWVSWVRGGRWAYDRVADAGALVPSPSTTGIAVSGDDVAQVRCDPSRAVCAVDLVLGPDWVQVKSSEQDWAVAAAQEIASGLSR
ncbi:hypothetical protein [Agromyces arachidis]|uniref:hypothetical protein n=1 Tax=Agromyces arachidis TaxID=766966 RepID=UPI0040566AE5